MRGVREVEQGAAISPPLYQPITHSLTHSLVLRVHEPTHEASSVAVAAQHLALPTTQPARAANLETPVEMVFRVHAIAVTLRACHGAVAVTALAQNARLLGRRRRTGGTGIATGGTRTRRIRPHGGWRSASREGDLARVELWNAGAGGPEALERSQLTGRLREESCSGHGDRSEANCGQWGWRRRKRREEKRIRGSEAMQV